MIACQYLTVIEPREICGARSRLLIGHREWSTAMPVCLGHASRFGAADGYSRLAIGYDQ